LKCARCRVLARLAGFDRASHEVGQFCGGCNRTPFLPPSNNRLCNGASKPFFTVFTYHLRNLPYFGTGQPLGHALSARGVHAHVQRAIETETETPFGGIDLGRTHAEVHQHASGAADRQVGQMAKTFMPNGKTRILDARCFLDGFGVLVEGQQTPLGREP
jgi:hypothetical protein